MASLSPVLPLAASGEARPVSRPAPGTQRHLADRAAPEPQHVSQLGKWPSGACARLARQSRMAQCATMPRHSSACQHTSPILTGVGEKSPRCARIRYAMRSSTVRSLHVSDQKVIALNSADILTLKNINEGTLVARSISSSSETATRHRCQRAPKDARSQFGLNVQCMAYTGHPELCNPVGSC